MHTASPKKPTSRRHGFRRAFTLIELLVVVSIIALLVSILLPAMGRARDQARAVVCSSMQRQFALAWITYTVENDGHIMRCFHGWGDNYAENWWVSLIMPYLDGIKWGSSAGGSSDWRKTVYCPASGALDKADGYDRRWIGINERLDPYGSSPPTLRISRIRNPAQTVVFTDSRWEIYTHLWGNSFVYRHGGDQTSNFAFADGHVQSARTRASVDLRGDGMDDAYPPKAFIYDPRLGTNGWPNLNYSLYE